MERANVLSPLKLQNAKYADENSAWLIEARRRGKKAFRVYVLGGASVGKTSLCFRMSKGLLVDVPPSDDDEVHVIDLNVSKPQLKFGQNKKTATKNLVPMSLEVIDCLASSATSISKTKREYPTAYVCAYSVVDKHSYLKAIELVQNLKLHAHAFHPILLVSCKNDLYDGTSKSNRVRKSKARGFASEHKVHFVETSAQNNSMGDLTLRVSELLLKYCKTYDKLNNIGDDANSSDEENDGSLMLCAANCGSSRNRSKSYNSEESIEAIDDYDRDSIAMGGGCNIS